MQLLLSFRIGILLTAIGIVMASDDVLPCLLIVKF